MPKQTKAEKRITKAIKQTRAAYQQTATVYDAFSAPFQTGVVYPKIVSVAERYLESLSGKEILDVGCGSGTLIQMFNGRGARCSGIDVTPAFVELAYTRGLSVVEASAHDLPFPDEVFDGAVSNFVLNYLPPEGQRWALQEKFRVLRPGGVIVLSYMHPFFMRVGRYQSTPPHYPSTIEDYFHPAREEMISFADQKFILHLLDWPEIVNMIIESGFCLRELIDAEVPKNLEQIGAKVKLEFPNQYARGFRYNPYGIFVVATK